LYGLSRRDAAAVPHPCSPREGRNISWRSAITP